MAKSPTARSRIERFLSENNDADPAAIAAGTGLNINTVMATLFVVQKDMAMRAQLDKLKGMRRGGGM
eukprot:g15199.t1